MNSQLLSIVLLSDLLVIVIDKGAWTVGQTRLAHW